MHGIIPRRKAAAKTAVRAKRTASARGLDAVALPERYERALARLIEKTGRPKGYHVRKALERYIEDTWDYLQAVEADKSSRKTISVDELAKKLRLED